MPAPVAPVVLTGCTVDLSTRTVIRGSTTEHLSELEAKLLRFLLDHPERDLSRDELIDGVWEANVVPRAVDISVRRLRMKIEEDHSRPRHVLSVRGVGYRFEPGTAASPITAGTQPTAEPPREQASLVCTEVMEAAPLWDQAPEAMRRAMSQRDTLLSTLARAGDGYVFSASGDRYDLAFASVHKALLFATQAQEALAGAEWPTGLPRSTPLSGLPVRMALHTGTPVTRLDPATGRWEYSGPVVRAVTICWSAPFPARSSPRRRPGKPAHRSSTGSRSR